MSIVNTETGELVELDKAAAERRAERITLRLDAIADNYAAVMPMIREAIEKRDDLALGYDTPQAYISDRFGGALQRLGVDVRRAVVGELSAAGMSTRAIAPVVGVDNATVHRDLRRVADATPESEPRTTTFDHGAGFVAPGAEIPIDTRTTVDLDTGEVLAEESIPAPLPTSPKIVGRDGKEYSRPEPSKPKRRPLPDAARDAGWDLRKSVERLERIADDDRFTANKDQMAPHLRSHLTNAIEVCQDLLDRINH